MKNNIPIRMQTSHGPLIMIDDGSEQNTLVIGAEAHTHGTQHFTDLEICKMALSTAEAMGATAMIVERAGTRACEYKIQEVRRFATAQFKPTGLRPGEIDDPRIGFNYAPGAFFSLAERRLWKQQQKAKETMAANQPIIQTR